MERYIKQINNIWERQKIIVEFDGNRLCLKKSGVTTQGRKEVEVGTLLLGNDKNDVTANKLLSYFQCFSFQ